jgi:hypothetical protein
MFNKACARAKARPTTLRGHRAHQPGDPAGKGCGLPVRAWRGVSVTWGVLFVLVNLINLMLQLASRDEPKTTPDWIDSMKASLSDFAELREH